MTDTSENDIRSLIYNLTKIIMKSFYFILFYVILFYLFHFISFILNNNLFNLFFLFENLVKFIY
jgi:hypothetical protein